jgi:Putative zinc finger in N-recognin (UBR box)
LIGIQVGIGVNEAVFTQFRASGLLEFSTMEETPRRTKGGTAAIAPRVVGGVARYPLAANVSFSPGGLSYSGNAEESLRIISDPSSMTSVIASAQCADDVLRQYSLLYAYRQFGQINNVAPQYTKHHLPSLAALAEAVWGRFTGCAQDQGKPWADALLSAYWRDETTPESVPTTEDQIASFSDMDNEAMKPPAAVESTAARLRRYYEQQSAALGTQRPHRPCGYIFKRGDIAWNCRSCQTDPTCVICNDCFQQSQHEGHEVYFHRTTPGGCCDCGDAEAWVPAGCCERHRPPQSIDQADSTTTATSLLDDDPMHAVRPPDATPSLPPRLHAALTVIIRAAVFAICDAIDGAGIGSDAVQWTKRWADEAARIANQAPHHEDYRFRCSASDSEPVTLQMFLTVHKIFPDNFRLQLRLHNDDVHTFEEVIDALHEPRSRIADGAPPQFASLVSLRENATEMTHHVDADGQVTVKTYSNIASAMKGYQRLKSRGLQCAVVTTAQVDAEHRARALAAWLTGVAAAHPAAQAILVQALESSNVGARMMPAWIADLDWKAKFQAFPPHWDSSYLTREEAERLHELAGVGDDFYAPVPYRLPSPRYHKSPHALWGTLPSLYMDSRPVASLHPFLGEQSSVGVPPEPPQNRLSESIYVIDTDLRKQQEGERITHSLYPHKLPGLHLISGIGTTRVAELSSQRPPLPSAMELRHLLATSSFRAPISPLLLLLLLDPYPTKQLRAGIHALFLSLFTNARFKSRFGGALAVAYRPLSTLFCAGIGTDADTPLHFTVQIFTAGSLVRALGHGPAVEQLLRSEEEEPGQQSSVGIFVPPIAHIIVRCIHTNLLGSTKEVNMILNNTVSQSDDDSQNEGFHQGNVALLPALTYVAGEHPLLTPLPAAPDDGFLDARSTRHKRLPHLLRDLDYVIETPGTALRLLLPNRFPVYHGPALSLRGKDVLTFSAVFARMLRLAQGMDPQKRKISGGHVEYETQRWLEAFGLSLNLGGTRDALAESPGVCMTLGDANDESYILVREATRSIIAALLREVKLWLYREGLLETGLPISPGAANLDLAQVEALQRSTLHASSTLFDAEGSSSSETSQWTNNSIALSCATGVKMTEIQLTLIENALKVEAVQRQEQRPNSFGTKHVLSNGPALGEWLRVPHSPLAGDSLSFHLPLHRAIAKCVKSMCSIVVPEAYIATNRHDWWKLPVFDDSPSSESSNHLLDHPLIPLIRTTLRTSNCRVVWSGGPDCPPQEAQRRRTRSRALSANLAVAKVLHSLADHPIRCLTAAQQIERHLWTRNGTSVAGMAMNYSSAPLCRSFRDLDLLLVQLSAAGMSCGLGARRVFSLLLSRFSLDGYLCDPERRSIATTTGPNSFSAGLNVWVNPPRLQDADHAVVLAESFFATLCVIVTELPLFPPTSPSDDSSLCQSIRRELIHALAAEPRTHSEAMTAASCGLSRSLESEGTTGKVGSAGLFRAAFSSVLKEIGKQKSQSSSRASSGPPAFELKADYCGEYDPTFFHLRRQEHQHAMDVIARLRRQKWGDDKDTHCLPIVCAPPKAHPRFLPCRLLLHLDSVDAALRRALLFALTNGSWVPPPEPFKVNADDVYNDAAMDVAGVSTSSVSSPGSLDVPIRTFNRRVYLSQTSVASFSKAGKNDPFSGEVVSTSSVSFLEVLQILTLQVHTLEECASLHMCCPDLDDEGRALSSSLSINSYLRRLVSVPESLADVWAFRPYPDGPLKSRGSGANRGSILGFLIALYEHRADHGGAADEDDTDYGGKDDDHGGARNLATSGLKWLLRVIHALVDGASSLSSAIKSATAGIPVRSPTSLVQVDVGPNSWTINEDVRSTIGGMLSNLLDLWPKPLANPASSEKNSAKGKEARKAAQQRVMDMMKRKQAAFAETISKIDVPSGAENEAGPEETDLCIICRCDDTDGENNGPIGYLGHVQRSRMLQMYSSAHTFKSHENEFTFMNAYRVVGHMGCQVR